MLGNRNTTPENILKVGDERMIFPIDYDEIWAIDLPILRWLGMGTIKLLDRGIPVYDCQEVEIRGDQCFALTHEQFALNLHVKDLGKVMLWEEDALEYRFRLDDPTNLES